MTRVPLLPIMQALVDIHEATRDAEAPVLLLEARSDPASLVVAGVEERVVGVHMIGPDAPEILQAVAIAVRAGLTKADFDATVALHPSMAEELVLMR